LLLLQDSLQLDGDAAGGGSVGEIDGDGSDMDDLDDYINKLDAGAIFMNDCLFKEDISFAYEDVTGLSYQKCASLWHRAALAVST
jgi:hypothetical protein